MEKDRPWTLLRGGKAERVKGLRLVQQAYAQEQDGSSIMELGVALLWLGEYVPAWKHFRSVIETYPMKGDVFYGMAGVAKWCLGKPDEAVSEWRAGLKAKYARASGLGIRMPLLLFFASVIKPGVFDNNLAKKLLQEKTTDRRINNWPAPIAKLVLDQISEGEFQKHCQVTNEQETRDNLWLAGFYRSLIGPEPVTPSVFKQCMRKLSDVSQPEWQSEDVLLARIWSEEFFLARHEAN